MYVDGNPVPTQPCGAPAGSRVAPVSLCFVTPAHTPGDAQITVRGPGGTSNAVPFTYLDTPAPTILTGRGGIIPATGPDVGGTHVQLHGTNLDQGVVYVDGNPVPTQQCGSSLCFDTPPHAPGVVQVMVLTPNGKTSNSVSFRYDPTPPPRIRSLAPAHGPDVGGTVVAVTGDNLDQGVVYVDGNPVETQPCGGATSVRSRGAPGVRLCFVTPPHAPGSAVITVRTPLHAESNAVTFQYDESPAPVIRAVTPISGPAGGGSRVTVVGTNLSQGTVYVDDTAVPTQSCTQAPPNVPTGLPSPSATGLCFVTPPHAAGTAAITVRTPNGKTSNTVQFRYTTR